MANKYLPVGTQTKAALAEKFNKRIDALIIEGFNPATLPPRITDAETYTHRELRKLVSAATVKKSSGVYQVGTSLQSEFRHSYSDAMLDIVNTKREKRNKQLRKIEVTENGRFINQNAYDFYKMGDLRSNLYAPLHKRKFEYEKQENDFIAKLEQKRIERTDKQLVDNIIKAILKNFGETNTKMNEVLTKIALMPADKVVLAYYSETEFTIAYMYYTNDAKVTELAETILKALNRFSKD